MRNVCEIFRMTVRIPSITTYYYTPLANRLRLQIRARGECAHL